MVRSYNYRLIGLNVPSSKNSKRIVRGRLINNQLTMDYYKFVIPKLEEMKDELLKELASKEKPYRFHFFYSRKDKRHFDYINVCQVIADALQKVGILEDDDMDNFIPVFDGYTVDKNRPGVIFYVQ